MDITLVDRNGRHYTPAAHRWRGDDGEPLHLPPLPGLTRSDVVTNDFSMWRYRKALPFADSRLSLGEGCTALFAVNDELSFLAKAEWMNPTCSFKDRGVSAMVTALKALGAHRILEDSSGNAGSSVAAYARAAGIEATIVVLASTSSQKVDQMENFGAKVCRVAGTRAHVADESRRMAQDIPYASHNWSPYFLHGIKTLGYEIWENLGFTLPDNIVTVAGSGSIALGLDLAFTELKNCGEIAASPRIFIGQPKGWDPIVATITRLEYTQSPRAMLAEGASIAQPVRRLEVADAVVRTGGTGVSVDDDDIAQSTRYLIDHGLYAEPTSAVAHAAFRKLVRNSTIHASEQSVLILTGTALKATSATRTALQRH